MRELVEYLVKLRTDRSMSGADVGRAITERRLSRGEPGVDRRRVWDWENLKTEIGVDDVSDWLSVVGATPDQSLHALALASGGGHADPQTEPVSSADELPRRPVAAVPVPTPEPPEVCEVPDARPVVGTCGRASCGGPLHAIIEADVWRGVRCDDCELETDLERARPAAEAVAGAYRRGAA